MHEMVARLMEAARRPYVRHKFRITKPSTPAQRMKRRMYYTKNKSKLKAKRKIYRMRSKVHNRLRKQMHQVTTLRHHTHVYHPSSHAPKHPGAHHFTSHPRIPHVKKPHFTSHPHPHKTRIKHMQSMPHKHPHMYKLKHLVHHD